VAIATRTTSAVAGGADGAGVPWTSARWPDAGGRGDRRV